jgi:L,D-transpeptidase catalytic domain
MVHRVKSRAHARPAGRGFGCALFTLSLLLHGCRKSEPQPPAPGEQPAAQQPAAPAQQALDVPTEPQVPMGQPVPLWQNGKVVRTIDGTTAERDYLVLDLGEGWTPYLFADGTRSDGSATESAYKSIYRALAAGEFPENLHGERAQDDKYLELYGILPTLRLVRERMQRTASLACAQELDLEPLSTFDGIETYSGNGDARKAAKRFNANKARLTALMHAQKVSAPEQVDTSQLKKREAEALARHIALLPNRAAIEATQQRLKCEGYFAGKGRYITGVIDWATHEALAEFERRHRVFSWGYIGKDSLVPLRTTPIEAEREGLLRVLTERAVEIAGVIEDGSTSTLADGRPRTWTASNGRTEPVPNLVAALRGVLVDAFGLQTPEGALAFLNQLGELPAGGQQLVAVEMPALPEYYGPDMALTLDYDRGDVWYDFPFGDRGQDLPQPVQRRPNVTVSVYHQGEKIPLARFGTTIGGWRSEQIEGVTMWKYKESPVGPRAIEEIIAAPVWLPPDSTPDEDLVTRNRKRKRPTDPEFVVNYHETGPSYASAYGLVAAYHREYAKRADGSISLGRDQGIRTHGSVDYMSIMRRHSHGCHRMHNHIALRLMSFILAHRPHERVGQESLGFKKLLTVHERNYLMDIKTGGYAFKLASPLFVHIGEGRIRGHVKRPIDIAIPKWNEEYGAYVMPDGSTVQIRGSQLIQLTPPLTPPPEAAADGTATSQLGAVDGALHAATRKPDAAGDTRTLGSGAATSAGKTKPTTATPASRARPPGARASNP